MSGIEPTLDSSKVSVRPSSCTLLHNMDKHFTQTQRVFYSLKLKSKTLQLLLLISHLETFHTLPICGALWLEQPTANYATQSHVPHMKKEVVGFIKNLQVTAVSASGVH